MQRITIPSCTNTTEVTSVLQAVTQFPTPKVMENFATALDWVDFETENGPQLAFTIITMHVHEVFFISDEEYNRLLSNLVYR